jgi:hypothetical protein
MRFPLCPPPVRPIFAMLLFSVFFSGCALSPRWVSLRKRERQYNDRLTRVHMGQTRADLECIFPLIKTSRPFVTGRLKGPGSLFITEVVSIDPDFTFLVTYRYKSYGRVPDPRSALSHEDEFPFTGRGRVGIRGIGNVSLFPRGTPFYRLHRRRDDLILAISPRVTATDSDVVYPPRILNRRDNPNPP